MDDAAAQLDAALALAEDCGTPHGRALALLALADLRQGTDDPATTQALIDEARALCVPLGAALALAAADAMTAQLAARSVVPGADAGAPPPIPSASPRARSRCCASSSPATPTSASPMR